MPTEEATSWPTPAVAQLSTVLASAARTAGFDLDLDELPIAAALRTDLVLDLLHAAARHATNQWTRSLLGDAEADLGPLLAGRDNVELTVAAYDGMGLETRHLLDRADLRPRPGKDQHAFCLDIDRAGDIRVLANVAPGEESLDTMLHEVGHAVYDDHVDRLLPWALRCPPQPLATEAVALMLGRLRRDPEFLVESLQGLRRPEGRTTPDWASKIHLAVAPVYYQSYLLGELMAFQVDAAVREAVGGFVGRPDAGAFLAERVFAPGASRTWRDLVVHATGRPLGPEAFLAGLEA